MGCHCSRESPPPRPHTLEKQPPKQEPDYPPQNYTVEELRQQGIERGMRAFAQAQEQARKENLRDQVQASRRARQRADQRAADQEAAARRSRAAYAHKVSVTSDVAALAAAGRIPPSWKQVNGDGSVTRKPPVLAAAAVIGLGVGTCSGGDYGGGYGGGWGGGGDGGCSGGDGGGGGGGG